MDQYSFQRQTYSPSLFTKQPLNVRLPVQIIGEDLVTDGQVEKKKNSYHAAIRAAIYARRSNDQAVLVVFKDLTALSAFTDYLSTHALGGKAPYTLEEKTENNERDIIIGNSTRTGAVTNMTRSFGRGVDFICLDGAVRSHGGVEVIQTFQSSFLSEEYQIKYRTCRQDDPGGYQKILYLPDLAEFKIYTQFEIDQSDKPVEIFLREKCEQYLMDTVFANVNKNLETNRKRHNTTLNMIDCYKRGHLDAATTHLLALNGIESE